MQRDIWESKDKLLNTIDGFFDDQSDVTRQIVDETIWRNICYYIGEQYLEYLRSSRSLRRRIIPDFVPTPVSNECREYVRSVKAMLMNQKMVPRVWPNTNEKEDVQASELGQNVLTWMDQSNDADFFDEKEKLCIWLPIAGTAFMRTYPDADGGLWLPDGSKTGDVAADHVISFNVRMDRMGDKLKKKRWVGIQSYQDKEWVEDTFKVIIENPGDNKAHIDYDRKLSKLIGAVSQWKGKSIDFQTLENDDDDLVLFREVEFKPTRDFPMGRYVVSCGGKILLIADRLPILSTAEEWNYSLTDFHFNYVPGRFWSDPGMNDLISPQNIINEIDQAYAINRKGVGRPRLMCPGEVGLKKMDMGGHGFLALTYNPIMGQAPTIHEGTPLPPQVLEERRLQQQVFQDCSGDPKNVLKGQQPSANASGVLTDSLRETAERGKYPDIDRFNRSLCRVYKKRLLLAQEIYTEERLIKVTGRGNKVKITKFKASDLRGNTDVRLELDSGLVATKSGQAQMILNMVQAGFFKKDETDPNVRNEILTRMGFTTFMEDVNGDVDRAEDENMRMASGDFSVQLEEQNPETGEPEVVSVDPRFQYDPHEVHYEIHRKYILSAEFASLPSNIQTVVFYHTDAHKAQIDGTPPDIRDYIQIDKLLLPGVLTESERAQILTKYLGIQAGDEGIVGLPSADTVTKAKAKLIDGDKKDALKTKQMQVDLVKHGMTEGAKVKAAEASKNNAV